MRIKNVRCFDDIDVTFNDVGSTTNWTLLLGDNAVGKSTFLRSIAMGLCDEASAAGLLKESDEGYIRRGQSKARITIWLYDSRNSVAKYRITTTIARRKSKRGIFSDIVRQTTDPQLDTFPWHKLFVSGYGAGRGVSGAGDISTYSAIDAVYNMFNYSEGLQNPELALLRLMSRDVGSPVEDRQIFKVLCSATGASGMRLTREGIRIDGPWGEGMPLRDLADGYRSSVLWITDLISWVLTFDPGRKGTSGVRGIVLIDEIEQHLHVRWQRKIVDDLRTLFPNIQFIASTHSPLVGASVGPTLKGSSTDRLYVLEAAHDNRVIATPHEFLRGLRMDQVLASRAFKYQVDADPETERALVLGSKLAGKKNRTEEEERTYLRIKEVLTNEFLTSNSPIEREAEQEADSRLLEKIKRLEAKLYPEDES